jgi:hypothetical protein
MAALVGRKAPIADRSRVKSPSSGIFLARQTQTTAVKTGQDRKSDSEFCLVITAQTSESTGGILTLDRTVF